MEAIGNTQVRAFTHKNLEEAFQQLRIIELFGRNLITQIMISLGQKIVDLQTKSTQKRYEELIEKYPDIIRRANLKRIVSYLGITQKSIDRIRSSFK
jgi:hypothetical protein